MTATTRSDVVVAGGGISGLTCAFTLQRQGFEVVVLERASEAGGNVRSLRRDGFLLERGPNTFMGSADDVLDLVDALDLGRFLVPTSPAAARRFIVRRGRLHLVPTGPLSFLTTRLLSLRGKLALAAEPFRSARQQPDDTAETFFARRFGREAGRILAGAFINGVYAGDPRQLSARAAFPLFWGFERDAGSMIRGAVRYRRAGAAARATAGRPRRSGLFSFEGGLGRLTAALAESLGERCRTGCEALKLVRRDDGFSVSTALGEFQAPRVVVAAPPREAASLLAGIDADAAPLVAATPMAPVVVAHLGFSRRLRGVPDGFGFLAPPGEGVRVLGILFASRMFADRAPGGGDLLTGFLGGTRDPGALALGDEEAVRAVLGDLERLVGPCGRPAMAEVMRYPGAIPQLTVGHVERMAAVAARLEAVPGLFLAGNYVHGVGLKDAVASGLEAARRLARETGREVAA